MAASDVTLPQDGAQGNVKLHPYLVTLVRWCVSCLWSTATVFLHRLLTTPLPQITASKPSPKPRQAGTDHLHPEPKVECVVLQTPASPTLDVIFVHGLYGSLGNTWRQGDWRSKYKSDPEKVPLRDHITQCKCAKPDQNPGPHPEQYTNETEPNQVTFKQVNSCFKKIIPNENYLITEKFYNNTFLKDVDIYESTQAKFVKELFKNDCDNIKKCDDETKCDTKMKCDVDKMKCKCDETKCENETRCEMGCGCVCDDCYSTCWPKDWIKEDFPGARVISINYTSDPYLWRPLWVKGNKRLRLHERSEQMTKQLLDLGVGQRPIIWVGHSKGGLFIKQIYCEAYEAYLECNKEQIQNDNSNNEISDIDIINKNINVINNNYETTEFKYTRNDEPSERNELTKLINIYENINMEHKNDNYNYYNDEQTDGDNSITKNDKNETHYEYEMSECKNETGRTREIEENEINELKEANDNLDAMSSNTEEDTIAQWSHASLWSQSRGFMFYSVPHRGSPLADIFTPITARSIELLEISKDCELVLALQSRWLTASRAKPPAVRSLVETCRTLMSVLWLRIVSVDSADAGIGSLHGVSVDHREICKPSSRKCLLYTELTELIRTALNKCDCQPTVNSTT